MIGEAFVASTTATRMMRVCKEARRPFPQLSDDDVIDYIVTEAITFKMLKEQKDAEQKAEIEKWKQQVGDLRDRVT